MSAAQKNIWSVGALCELWQLPHWTVRRCLDRLARQAQLAASRRATGGWRMILGEDLAAVVAGMNAMGYRVTAPARKAIGH
jgi:hypothetical protein